MKLEKTVKLNVSRIMASFFSERVINAWNSLPVPDNVVNFSSLPRFRRSI